MAVFQVATNQRTELKLLTYSVGVGSEGRFDASFVLTRPSECWCQPIQTDTEAAAGERERERDCAAAIELDGPRRAARVSPPNYRYAFVYGSLYGRTIKRK